MCQVFLVFPSWSVTPLSCHWAHWSEGWLCKEWINLCNWEYLYQQPLPRAISSIKSLLGRKLDTPRPLARDQNDTRSYPQSVVLRQSTLEKNIMKKSLEKYTHYTMLWQPLGDEMGAHRSCHYQDWPHVSKTSGEQKVPGCQCPVWSHFKMVQNIK